MDSALAPPPRAHAWASPKVALRPVGDGFGVFTSEAISAGELLLVLAPVFLDHPERHTIQVDERVHQSGTGHLDAFLNHACAPSTIFDFERLELRAARPLAAGEEVNFNYLSSEWDLDSPFTCQCGAPGCHGLIRGFRHLNAEQQEALAPVASPYLRRRLAELRALRAAG